MTGNPFDQGSRYAVKQDPEGMLAWLLRLPPGAGAFRGWLDTRLLPFPGEPDRTCDTVAHLEDVAAGQAPWAVVVEFQIAPDPRMFGRTLGYLGTVWLELRPSEERGDRFNLGAVVVNLTGRGNSSRRMEWAQAGLMTTLQVVERNLAEEDAQATLAEIAAGRVTRAVLPFIPLMQGGAEPGIIQQWLALAAAEPDARRRGDHGGLALVFAEAAGRQDAWKHALKGWNMVQSKQVLEWQAEAVAETLLDLLQEKFGSIPAEVSAGVRAIHDLAVLKRITVAVARASSMEEFRQAAQL